MLRTLLSALVISILIPLAGSAQEICNNGIDDDGDGLIDLNDPDCPCSTLIAADSLQSYIRNHSFEERLCCPYTFVSIVSPPWLDCATGWHQATSATSDYFNMCGYAPAGFNFPPPDGDAAVGFFAMPGYFEYVGTCLTYPLPSNPLQAGVTYTLSLWISTSIVNSMFTHTQSQGSYTAPFTQPFPLALFGYADACVPFPIETMDCIGYTPGWSELGRVDVQPAWDWTRVSITFTPTQNIHSILIGGACDVPASFDFTWVTNPTTGDTYVGAPYFVVDDLLLTIAADQVLQPVSVSGTLCAEDAGAAAVPPAGATGYQWYSDGVALVGQTGTSLNISGQNLGGGVYTMSSTFSGECLMGSAYMAPAIQPIPRPALSPTEGCSPVNVQFADTTGLGSQTVLWDLGDGSTSTDSSFAHSYTVPGSYDVTLTVRSDAGCTADTVLTNAITVFPGVNGQISVAPDPVDADAPTVDLSGIGSGNILSWWWDLGVANPSTADSQQITADFPNVPGSYPVVLVITTTAGCIDTVYSMVTVVRFGEIQLPNVFSPNGDGQNESFRPIEANGATGLMEVFNRWGQRIFSTRSLARGWDGHDAPDGTYFYVVTPDLPGTGKITGYVTLIR
ncbi:MAG: PKD domain-containing protein [Flavobacteriales bacterium]